MSTRGRADEPAITVRPRTKGRKVVLAILLVLVVGVLGELLELLAYVVAPVSRIPAVRRWLERKETSDEPTEGIEVRTDRVATIGTYPQRTIDHVERAVLGVRTVNGAPALYVVGTFDDGATIGVAGYDLDDLGDALLTQGWRWQPPGGAVEYPQTQFHDDATPEFEIVLREGWDRPVPARGISVAAIVMAVAALAAYVVAYLAGVRGMLVAAVPLAVAALFALGLIGLALVWHRRSRVTFAVDGRRIVVSWGRVAKLVVTRTAITDARVGRRCVRVKQRGQPFHTYLPLVPRRDQVLTAMRTYGWPVG